MRLPVGGIVPDGSSSGPVWVPCKEMVSFSEVLT